MMQSQLKAHNQEHMIVSLQDEQDNEEEHPSMTQ